MRKLVIFIIAAVMLFSLTACDGNTVNKITGADYPVTVWGIEIKSCPQKVICLSPAVTDIVIALGSDAQLIGVYKHQYKHTYNHHINHLKTPKKHKYFTVYIFVNNAQIFYRFNLINTHQTP